MDKTISVTDLQLIPELKHLRMLDFINPDNDKVIAPYLKILGFDLEYPIAFIPSQHRNMQGRVVIAYIIAGEVEINDSFQSSSFCTPEDRQIAAGYRDMSMANDLAQGAASCRDYGNDSSEGFPPDQSNPDENDIMMQIKVLEDLLLNVRGNPYKQDGSRKLYCESDIIEAPEKRRKKPVRYVRGNIAKSVE